MEDFAPFKLLVLALIIGLVAAGFGGYFGFYGRLWTGLAPGFGIGVAVLVLLGVLLLGGTL